MSLAERACSILAAPLILPPVACCILGLAVDRALRKGKRNPKMEDAVRRTFETGPWGPIFDRLTWLPWTRSAPRCLYLDASVGVHGPAAELLCSSLPPPPHGTKRLVVVSDTHGKHRLLRLPAGDVLVHCGDLLSRGGYVGKNRGTGHRRGFMALSDFNAWLGQQPHTAKVVIAGNHDAPLEALPSKCDAASGADALLPSSSRERMLSNAVYLQDSVASVEGLSFYGSPWSFGKSSNRAFQAAAPTIPAGLEGKVDVLMSHCHHNALSVAVQPTLHVSGHNHNTHGLIQADEAFEGVAINASICDGVYRPTKLPVVVDLAPRCGGGTCGYEERRPV